MYYRKYRSASLSQDISWDILRPNSVLSVVNSCSGKRKLPGPSPGTCLPGFCPGKMKFAPTVIAPQDNCTGGQNPPHPQNSFQRANYILPFHHFTIAGNVSQKDDSPLENFTISPLHHNDFTISPYVQKILIHHYTIGK